MCDGVSEKSLRRRRGATGGRRLRDPRRPTLVPLQAVLEQLGRGGVHREGVPVDHAEVHGRRGGGCCALRRRWRDARHGQHAHRRGWRACGVSVGLAHGAVVAS